MTRKKLTAAEHLERNAALMQIVLGPLRREAFLRALDGLPAWWVLGGIIVGAGSAFGSYALYDVRAEWLRAGGFAIFVVMSAIGARLARNNWSRSRARTEPEIGREPDSASRDIGRR